MNELNKGCCEEKQILDGSPISGLSILDGPCMVPFIEKEKTWETVLEEGWAIKDSIVGMLHLRCL